MKNNKCDLCDKDFSQSHTLKRHIDSVHEGLKNHKYDFCDKNIRQSQTLKKHITTVHEKLKNHKCDKCNKAFIWSTWSPQKTH